MPVVCESIQRASVSLAHFNCRGGGLIMRISKRPIVLGLALQLFTGTAAVAQQSTSDAEAAAREADAPERGPSEIGDPVIVLGTRAEGYVSNTVSRLGPLGEGSILETPVSVYVMSRHLIENLQVTSPDMLYKVNPVVHLTNQQSRFFSMGSLRGFSVGTTYRTDGAPLYDPWISPDIEDKEQVEVTTGLSGFMNGVGNIGGTINYIRKRPTDDALANLTLGVNGGENLYIHGDFGGPIGDTGKFGYRVNVLAQDGDTATTHQSIEKTFGSAAFDWHVTEDLLFQVDASYADYTMRGSDVYWDPFFPSGGVSEIPAAPSPSRSFTQPWTVSNTKQDHIGARMTWDIGENVSIRAAVEQHNGELDVIAVNHGFVEGGNPGDYTVYAPTFKYPETDQLASYAFLHWNFATGPLSHRVTTGYYGNDADRTNFSGTFQGYPDFVTPTVYNFNNPTPLLPAPDPFEFTVYRQANSRNDNFVLADQIDIGERWNVLVGLNHSTIKEKQFDVDGSTVIDEYDESHVAPSYALLYRINSVLSAYGSYMEGLERGGTAGATFNGFPVVNAGETLEPLVSDQVEIGLKAQWANTLFTAALFEINKGLEYYDSTNPTAPVYTQNGRQVHRGVELTLTGKVFDDLIVVAGLTALDPEIKNNSDPTLIGNRPEIVAKQFGTLYLEYQVPVLPELILTAGMFYTGDLYIDIANTLKLPSVTTFDAGARYETELFGGRRTTFRLNVTNATNEGYWLDGTNLGQKRAVLLSATVGLL